MSLASYLIIDAVIVGDTLLVKQSKVTDGTLLVGIKEVLKNIQYYNKSITIRSQGLSSKKVIKACKDLITQEDKFHPVFNTGNKPVSDNNTSLRVNSYSFHTH